MKPRSLALCADDFGWAPQVDQAIDRLVWQGRLGAVSMLVNGRRWEQGATLSRPWPATVQRGLHFNLTQGVPVSRALRRHWNELPRLPTLMALAHTNALPLAALGHELREQWQHFCHHTGTEPAFLDGHQHVHHLPGVREAVLAVATPRALPVRNTGSVRGGAFKLKRQLIALTGGRALQKRLRELALPHNSMLLGVYDFRRPNYRSLMQRWLEEAAQAPEGSTPLLFCHPGDPAAPGAPADEIGAARVQEATYLHSPAFDADLSAAGVVLVPPFGRSAGPGAVRQKSNVR
jgi:predicted glycoside hydrolase/deacetylase ChbG (UPF0249 family)